MHRSGQSSTSTQPPRQWTRFKRRALRHHLVLAPVSTVVVFFVYILQGPGGLPADFNQELSDTVLFRWSIATAYTGLGLVGATLLIGPLNVLRGHRNPVSIDLRRDIGIWAGIISLVHVTIGLQVHTISMSDMVNYFFYIIGPPKYVAIRTDLWGFANYAGLMVTLLIALLLALSNDRSLRRLKPERWKALHRSNYALFMFLVVHGIAYQALESRVALYLLLFGAIAVAVLLIQLVGFRRRKRDLVTARQNTQG